MSSAAVLLRTLTAAATPGPWAYGFADGSGRVENGFPKSGGDIRYDNGTELGSAVVSGGADSWGVPQGVRREEDAALIVALRNAADEIADLIEAAETVVILEYDRTRTDAENDQLQRRGKAFRDALAAVERELRPE